MDLVAPLPPDANECKVAAMAIDRVGRTVVTVEHQIDRTEDHWVVVAVVATGLVSIILGVATLSGFQSSGSGDLVVSSTMGGGLNLAIMLVGTLALLSLELAHRSGRRARHARVAVAAGRAFARPRSTGSTGNRAPVPTQL